MSLLVSFLVGLLFGCGILVGGMGNPDKVLAFLDLAGYWDPSLILVMGGAIAVTSVAYYGMRERRSAVLGQAINWPGTTLIDRRLVLGSALFGTGWGLAGICPGPGLVLLGDGVLKGLFFVLAMLAGMALFEILERRKKAA